MSKQSRQQERFRATMVGMEVFTPSVNTEYLYGNVYVTSTVTGYEALETTCINQNPQKIWLSSYVEDSRPTLYVVTVKF